ncbi:hypothetical protein N8525_02535 [Verrucomicrobiales bacterium]|nr:hypothetical protein [Verrucomicrobiales bacterium]
MIEAAAEIDASDNQEKTPLFLALQHQNWDEARELIARGADPGVEVQGGP